MIGEEPDFPYERPPLSKDYLLGKKAFERIMIRPSGFWEERLVTLRLATRVVSADPEAHEVRLNDGSSVGYGSLIWATGGSARRLSCSGYDFAGIHTVRNRADVDRLLVELDAASRVVIVGGGYIGLEAAAALSTLGKKVVVLEALDRVLARVAGEPLSRFFEAEHRAHGVDIRLGSRVDCIEGRDGRVSAVRLAGGEHIGCEMVIVGIGIKPEVEPLTLAGAEGSDGVAVDPCCRTSLKDVFAIGDCAQHANRYAAGSSIRLESVQNANDQAMVVAKVLTGLGAAYNSVPWFWSNQYDLRLQTVGLSLGYDDVVLRGSLELRSFSLIYLHQGRVIALDCVNSIKDYVAGKELVLRGLSPSRSDLANVSLPLKDFVA